MQGIKEFFAMGGGGGSGMFSLTEWIMKGAVWPRAAAALRGAWIPDGGAELRQDELGLMIAGVEICMMVNQSNRNKTYII